MIENPQPFGSLGLRQVKAHAMLPSLFTLFSQAISVNGANLEFRTFFIWFILFISYIFFIFSFSSFAFSHTVLVYSKDHLHVMYRYVTKLLRTTSHFFTFIINFHLCSRITDKAGPPTRHSTIGDLDRAFPVAASRVWNSLPSSVTSSTSLSAFRRRLKTELFSRCFGLDSVWNCCSMLSFCVLFYCKVFLQS